LAVRLQAAGIATTVLEARDRAGGGASAWQQDGFTFDADPALLLDPGALAELWHLSGHDLADDIELLAVDPPLRVTWPDGSVLDLTRDRAQVRRQFARLARHDAGGFDAYMHHADRVRAELAPLLAPATPSLPALVRAFVKLRAWRSPHAVAGRCVGDARLRQALSARTLEVGGNPLAASSLPLTLAAFEQGGGAWCARGGRNRLAAALVRQLERLGGVVRLGEPASRIVTDGRRATAVETRSGWHGEFDAVASNADRVHTCRDLVGRAVGKLMANRYGPGQFVLDLGVAGTWPGIPHRTILLGDRFAELFADIFARGVLPADLAIDLYHPSVTDPSLAPDGASAFTAVVPVPHLGKLAVDWQQVGSMLEQRILDILGRRLVPDIQDRVVLRRHRTPRDAAEAFNRHLGSAFGLEPTVGQSGGLRPRERDAAIRNLHFVGADTRPGEGLPGVLAGASATAGQILRELAA
jgi:phytoene desaturase